MKVFVTGATGLIGGAAVRALVAAGHEVTGLTSRAGNKGAVEAAGARAVVGDMRDAAAYREAAHAADAIVHAASTMPEKFRYTQADVDKFMEADAAAVDALASVAGPSLRAFVFTSGAYVYGDTGTAPVDETHTTANHHAVMRRKVQTEAKLLGLAQAGRLPVTITRPGLVYGDGGLWSNLYLKAMKRGQRALMPGDGRNMLSFVHVDDVGAAYRHLVEHPTPGEVYNIADDEPAPLGEVVRALADEMGAPPPRAVPGWLLRLAAGSLGATPTLAHTVLSSRKLKSRGFAFRYPHYREGIAALARSLRS